MVILDEHFYFLERTSNIFEIEKGKISEIFKLSTKISDKNKNDVRFFSL